MDEREASAPVLSINENVSEDGTVKPTNNNRTRICLVGDVGKDERTCLAAQKFGVLVASTETGSEFVDDGTWENIFVMHDFTGTIFDNIYRCEQRIVGPTALQQYASKEGGAVLPVNTRPLYTLAMSGFVICFTGFRKKEDLTRMMQLIHNMGGSIRKEMSTKVTHLIANCCDGEKYTYASTFRVPIVGETWVRAVWDRRDDPAALAGNADLMAAHKLKPFHNACVCFHGFPDSERRHMTDVLVENGGRATEMDDPACSYVVVDESRVKTAFSGAHSRATLVKAEWFWVSVQNETCADATEYRFQDYLSTMLSPVGGRRPSLAATPASTRGGARKRKRLLDGSSAPRRPHNDSPAVHKRRSSVSDAGLLSMSGSFLDATGDDLLSPTTDEVEAGCQAGDTPRKPLTARHHVFLELVQTETNYVDILHTIVTLFKGQLEDVEEGDEPLLNKAEMKIIFGNLPPIYEVHSKMLAELRVNALHWREDVSIGKILLKYNESMESAYPPFINYFENMREMLTKCDQEKSRFHAFLKVCQTRPECSRQSLQELMIRPVQRLPSISLLLNDILKHTPKSNADHACLEQALCKIKAAMTHINEDKRKTEGQLAMFEIFHEIDNCPPELLSSSRNLIARCDVIELGDGISGRGDSLVLFVFSDTMEVCKRRSRAFNTLKSPSAVGHLKPSSKPYKHLRQMPLTNIKRIIDVKESDDSRNAFALICRGTHDPRERTYSMAVADDETDKLAFLCTLASTVAGLGRDTQDINLLLYQLEGQDMEACVSTSDLPVGGGGTLGKAFKFATRTRLKVGRAFSFNKTPSKLKRAVSTMIGSPFVSTATLTPSSQLAQMRLASCSNLSEHSSPKEEGTYVAPMSVQPTRKNKCGTQSLSVAALRRL